MMDECALAGGAASQLMAVTAHNLVKDHVRRDMATPGEVRALRPAAESCFAVER